MGLSREIAPAGHVLGSGPSWANVPPNGVGEGASVAVGIDVEVFTVGEGSACGADASVHAVRTNNRPVNAIRQERGRRVISVSPLRILIFDLPSAFGFIRFQQQARLHDSSLHLQQTLTGHRMIEKDKNSIQ
jgi:hypothetical protein